jgi:cellulose synthase/poly-beta-1,6-N-acetylglucosamine synthase-like glycosyltransferase
MTWVWVALFWVAAAGVVYAYFGYPLVLWLLRASRPDTLEALPLQPDAEAPTISMIVPAYNERDHIAAKMANTAALDYPAGKLEVLYVSDGSTDGTTELIGASLDGRSDLLVLPGRSGKAAALNAGLARARHDIIVFTDASIALAPDALRQIVRTFADPAVGCVSGEDVIEQSGGEALYGRYELFIRRQESRLHSIVGASGSFYAQRRALCAPFEAGLAPDFLSVLRVVRQGSRAVAEPAAVGTMAAVSRTADEFQRKVRTLLRGMSTLGYAWPLLNPLRYGWFAFALWSHKVLRWLVPVWLLVMLASSAVLAVDSLWYRALLAGQMAFYALAAVGIAGLPVVARTLPAKVAVFFTVSNAAALAAWVKYVAGVRQEIWSPSRRSS